MFVTVNDLPSEVRAQYSPEEQAEYLRVYNAVYQQTNDELKSTAAALGAVTKMRMTTVRSMRSADNGDLIIGGWMMKFGTPQDKDSYDTFFSSASKLMLEYYPNAPLWMEHGMDNDYGVDPIGMRTHVEIYGHGIWGEHRVYANHPRFSETKQGLENSEFSYSSDSIGHYVEKGYNEVNGRMDVWPFAGCSLTRSPAEVSLGPVALRSFAEQIKLLQDTQSRSEELEAREAQEATEKKPASIRKSSQGDNTMDPAKLAALAQFLGCEATPQAVTAALQELTAQLAQQPAAGAQPDPEQEAMMSQLRAAFGLAADCKPQDVIAKMDEIKSMLTAGRSLNMGALKKFVGLVNANLEEEDDAQPVIPFVVPRRSDDEDDEEEAFRPRRNGNGDRQVNFKHNRGSKQPGLLDVIGAISQIQNGPVQYEMPAFKSQRTSPSAALRAMNINNAQSGGWMLNREMSTEILQALYADLVLEQLGAKTIPMDGIESITMNRVQSGAVAYWAGTSTAVSDANAKISAAVTLQTKELVSKAIIENKLLRNSAGSIVESMVQDDIIKVMKLRMEYAALYGTGGVPVAAGNSGAEPLGLINTTGVTKTSLASKTPTIKDLIDMEGRIEDTNIDYDQLQWLSSKRARRMFKGWTDANGNPQFAEDWVTNDIKSLIVQDHPFVTTTQIANTTSGQNITTDLFLGDWTNMLIGQGVNLEMVVDTSKYVEERSTLIQVVSYVDFGVAYKEAFQVLQLMKVN